MMEIWIASGVAIIALAALIAARLRRSRRRAVPRDPKNIYPLW
jgi:heme exporter protein D